METMWMIITFLLVQDGSATSTVTPNGNLKSGISLNRSVSKDNSCYDFTPKSCSGSCGEYFEIWCSCDEYCHFFDRCCFDYYIVCKEEARQSKQDHQSLLNVSKECYTSTFGYAPQLVITSCPVPVVSKHLVQLCEDNHRSPILPIVMSNKTKLHYNNIHCMQCNGEVEEDTIYWDSMTGVNNQEDMETFPDSFNNSVISFPTAYIRNNVCYPRMITSCPVNTASEDRRLCLNNVISPIMYLKMFYKNTFCLQCNVNIRSDRSCRPAGWMDVLRGSIYQTFTLSAMFKWTNSREVSISFSSKKSFIENVKCSVKPDGYLFGCTITKCRGTMPVIDQSCKKTQNHFGCIYYSFNFNFTLPLDDKSDHEKTVQHISSHIEQTAQKFEHVNNITQYYSRFLEAQDVAVTNGQLTGKIILTRMAYDICILQYDTILYENYFDYLNTTLVINLDGTITTCRYTVLCYEWCEEIRNDLSCAVSFRKQFTSNGIRLDISREKTIMAVYFFIVMFTSIHL